MTGDLAAAGRMLNAGRFLVAETGTGELAVTWILDDGTHGGISLPAPIYALLRAAAAGEKVSLAAVARAMRA